MKKLLITAAAFLVTLSVFAQGQVDFKNDSTTLVLNAFKAGSPAVVVADGIVVALYWAPGDGNFRQIGPSSAIPFPPTPATAGRITAGPRTTETAPSAASANQFQVKAWELAYGTTYEQAVAAAPIGGRIALRGVSNVFNAATTDGVLNPPGALIPGLQGFSVNVPEPSTIALGLIGAGALLMLRRRK